jgi:broad specificity phosphatase PhoE
VQDLRGHEGHALTDHGHEQARLVAERCREMPIGVIIASTMVRAHDTASYISKELNLEPTYNDLFIEAQGPSEYRNLPRDHAEGIQFDQEMQVRFEDPDWRFSDAENFHDLKTRALAALELLAAREEENVLVVTHGFFMRIMIACVVLGPELTAKECRGFIRAFHMENTGVSVFGFEEKNKERPWWVWTWNDHAHLS